MSSARFIRSIVVASSILVASSCSGSDGSIPSGSDVTSSLESNSDASGPDESNSREPSSDVSSSGASSSAGSTSDDSGEVTTAALDEPTADGGPIPIVFDYSPTLSDVAALMYLTQHDGVELLAVTLAGTGESHCEAGVANTIELLALTGLPDVPVACGRTTPIGPGNVWPDEWRERSDELAGLDLASTGSVDLSVAAADLIADVVAAHPVPVTIIAVGPLTNLAVALEAHEDLADDVAAIYTMGGALDVAGNAPNGTAEWNYFIDPTAVDVVFGSGIPITLVPLDATDDVPLTYDWFVQLAAHHTTPAATVVHDLLSATPGWDLGFDFWDELAAAVALDPTLVTFEDRTVTVVTDGDDAGRTMTDADGVGVRVALSPDTERFEHSLLVVLNGGAEPPEQAAAAPQEIAYFDAVSASTTAMNAGIAELFESPEATSIDELIDPDATTVTAEQERALRTFFRTFWTGAVDLIEAHAATLKSLDVPESVRVEHDALVDALDALVADETSRLSALDGLEGEELMGFLWSADANIERVDSTCSDLALQATTRGLVVDTCPG